MGGRTGRAGNSGRALQAALLTDAIDAIDGAQWRPLGVVLLFLHNPPAGSQALTTPDQMVRRTAASP
jgi:hypothetical protein